MKTTFRVTTSFGGGSFHRTEEAGRRAFAAVVKYFRRSEQPVTVTLKQRDASGEQELASAIIPPLARACRCSPWCSVWGDAHRWVFQSHGKRGVLEDVYQCACGREALSCGDWPERPIIIEAAEEAAMLGALPAWEIATPSPRPMGVTCVHGTLDPDNPNDPCVICAMASAEEMDHA